SSVSGVASLRILRRAAAPRHWGRPQTRTRGFRRQQGRRASRRRLALRQSVLEARRRIGSRAPFLLAGPPPHRGPSHDRHRPSGAGSPITETVVHSIGSLGRGSSPPRLAPIPIPQRGRDGGPQPVSPRQEEPIGCGSRSLVRRLFSVVQEVFGRRRRSRRPRWLRAKRTVWTAG